MELYVELTLLLCYLCLVALYFAWNFVVDYLYTLWLVWEMNKHRQAAITRTKAADMAAQANHTHWSFDMRDL